MDQRQQNQKLDMESWKPGSQAADARNVGGKGDFGVPVGTGPSRERNYVSENTKRSDPGATHARAGEDGADGARTAGAGGVDGGEGSSSGGDLDPDITGVGFGGSGLASSAPTGRPGADDTTGSSDEFASGRHARGDNQTHVGEVGGAKRVAGSTVRGGVDMQTGPWGQGADAATNPAVRGDDAFAGEVSTGEAMGQDSSLSPSQETQGLRGDDNQSGGQKDFDT